MLWVPLADRATVGTAETGAYLETGKAVWLLGCVGGDGEYKYIQIELIGGGYNFRRVVICETRFNTMLNLVIPLINAPQYAFKFGESSSLHWLGCHLPPQLS